MISKVTGQRRVQRDADGARWLDVTTVEADFTADPPPDGEVGANERETVATVKLFDFPVAVE